MRSRHIELRYRFINPNNNEVVEDMLKRIIIEKLLDAKRKETINFNMMEH